MSARMAIVTVAMLALFAWIATQTFFVVQQAQMALLTRLGKPLETLTQPGLYIKYPFIDSAVFFDGHLLSLQPSVDQIILGDQKRIEVATLSRFRIDNPLRFYQSVGTEDQARAELSQIISSTVRKQLGKVALPALLTQERDQITDRIRGEVASQAANLGVVVTDVRILRAELPAETSQAIYERMTSERVREAKELRAQGFEWAQEIRSKADRDRSVLLSDSLRASQTQRGLADAEANSIAVAAFAQNPEFYDLYRTMQVYRSALTQGSPTFVLAPSNELMRFFDGGPQARKAKELTNPAASSSSTSEKAP